MKILFDIEIKNTSAEILYKALKSVGKKCREKLEVDFKLRLK